MPVRPQNNGPTEGLSAANTATVKGSLGKKLSETEYRWLLVLIAETLDEAAGDSNAWLSIGKNRNGDAFLLTYHGTGGVAYAGGHSLHELSAESQNILEG